VNFAAAFIFGIAGAIVFALLSDRVFLAIRDAFGWDFGIGIYSLLDSVRHIGSAFCGILAAVSGYILSARYSRSAGGEHRTYRAFFVCITFVVSVALGVFLSFYSAYGGARAAGVGTGGFGWQFLFALYGGPIVGLALHLIIFFRTWAARHDILFSFVGGSLLPPLAVFVLSLLFHLTFVFRSAAMAPSHHFERSVIDFQWAPIESRKVGLILAALRTVCAFTLTAHKPPSPGSHRARFVSRKP